MLALAAILALSLAQPLPTAPLPPQPFTIELLDLKRGDWHFEDAFGQRLSLPGSVDAWAYPGADTDNLELKYLCCDPEYPEDRSVRLSESRASVRGTPTGRPPSRRNQSRRDFARIAADFSRPAARFARIAADFSRPAALSHAELRSAKPLDSADGRRRFRIDEPFFSATVEVAPPVDGAARCTLSDIRFGPAAPGDRYVSAVYLAGANRCYPLWLASHAGSTTRLLTSRIGNVFAGAEPVVVTVARLGPPSPAARVSITVRDCARGDVVWRDRWIVPIGAPGRIPVTLPLSRFGIFEVTATVPDGGAPAVLRICRIPQARRVDPDASRFGINLFQMQVWWYAHQAPLMAKAGVHWIRPWLAWENTWASQMPAPNRWETRPLDAALRRMDRLGLRYQTILYGAPGWVLGGSPGPAPPPERTAVWAAYVAALARRYRGRIPAYEIWNEPDGMWPEATRNSGRHYMDLLRTGYAAIKRADPNAKVLGLSHAGYMQWLENVGRLGAAAYMDIATLHNYAMPDSFLNEVETRKQIMRRTGMGRVPIWFNEFGVTANDFSPAYSHEFACSEQRQAEVLVENYAQALSVSPGAKAFWFCTLDPRDPFHKDQWTGDAGIGVLYLGLLPKLAYASLAGAASELDCRSCLGAGRLDPGLRVVAYAGQVAVIWAEKELRQRSVSATQAGCAPDERIVVRDLLANRIAAGPASRIRLDLTRGPLYVEGSRELATALRVQTAAQPDRSEADLMPGRPQIVLLRAPASASVTVRCDPRTGIVAKAVRRKARWAVAVSARGVAEREHGSVRVTVKFPAGALGLRSPRTVSSEIWAGAGAPSLLPIEFRHGGTDAWSPERAGPYARDPAVGHYEPGCLRLDGPFDRRLVYWGALPRAGRPLNMRVWVRTRSLTGAKVTVSLALFGDKGWLRTWCLASTDPARGNDPSWRAVPNCGAIPTGTSEWTSVEATLPAALLTPEVTKTAFLIDASGGGSGSIWFDDFDLWQ
jgi:hypothetical protein